MLKTVIIGENIFEPENWESFNVESVVEFLMERFVDKLPDTARIYNGQVSTNNDVTPSNLAEIERLDELEGTFYVIVYPADPVTIVVAVLAVAFIITGFLLTRREPIEPTRSPNQGISDRQNQARVNGRIPDIFGTVKAVPDLITSPYRVFENNREVEFSYLCIGRGQYLVSPNNVKEGESPVYKLQGSTIEIYEPYSSPNSSNVPQLKLGPKIQEDLFSGKRCEDADDIIMIPPNSETLAGSNDIRFVYPNKIEFNGGPNDDLGQLFSKNDLVGIINSSLAVTLLGTAINENVSVRFVSDGRIEFESFITENYQLGDVLHVTNANFGYIPALGTNADFAGDYEIIGISSNRIFLRVFDGDLEFWQAVIPYFEGDPGKTTYKVCTLEVETGSKTIDFGISATEIVSVSQYEIYLKNPTHNEVAWAYLSKLSGQQTAYFSPSVISTTYKLIDNLIIQGSNLDYICANFYAPDGLWRAQSSALEPFDIDVEIEIRGLDNLPPSAPGSFFSASMTIEGSSDKKARGKTLRVDISSSAYTRFSVKVWRVTAQATSPHDSWADELRLHSLYGLTRIDNANFGNVTTIYSQTRASQDILELKSRKLNVVATRMLPTRVSGSTFTATKTETNSADEIIASICQDQRIGNRTVNEIDFDSIYDSIAEVETYFGTSLAKEFNYSFDEPNMSFEETLSAIAHAMHCIAYRQGSVIKIAFEKETEDSVLLFNHRNKVPDSETRSVRFGNQNDYDGVEYHYTDSDGLPQVIRVPDTPASINPRKVDSVGIRNRLQAYFHAWRIWNKIQYQNTFVEFEATQEANLLNVNDRILVADNTRTGTQDGEVVSQNGLVLQLSQKPIFEVGKTYTIFLQHTDGSIQGIAVTPSGLSEKSVVLAESPYLPLALDDDLFARATYQIVEDTSVQVNAFLVSERAQNSNLTATVKAVNYASEYYQNDKDYENEIVDEEGYPIV